MKFLLGMLGLSAVFILLERIDPWREQRFWRKKIGQDLFYLFMNGYLLGAGVSYLLWWVDGSLLPESVTSLISLGLVSDWPWWGQFLVVFFFIDFFQWLIHNLLHRVPFLWEFHKTHHSIEEMDWIGQMRFHWMEWVVYRTLLYFPFTLLDISPSVLFASGLLTLAVGFFNHSNLDVDIGKLGYFLNNPRMHIWHHTHPDCGPTLCNFGINLSLWDWIFGTAYQPEGRSPERIGLAEEDRFPDSLVEQLIYPLRLKKGS